jgi:hypothetical protein
MKTILLKTLISLAFCLAVVTSVNAADRWIKVDGGKWEPNPVMLSDLQAQIEPYVKSQAKAHGREVKRWGDYTFQYQGQEERGRKFIFINALCVQRDRERLDKEIIIIFDGGSCFFNLKYDPVRKLFFDLMINGEA